MGRRRKRRKKIIIWKPTMPTRFRCPNCDAETLVVEIDKKDVDKETGYVLARIKCGNCGLYSEKRVPPIFQPVDVYSKFLDEFLEGKAEYIIRKEGGSEETTTGEIHEMERASEEETFES